MNVTKIKFASYSRENLRIGFYRRKKLNENNKSWEPDFLFFK